MSNEALEASIESWKRKRDEEDPNKIQVSTDACPLCALHYDSRVNSCSGCPVSARTGKNFCRNTPWEVAALRLNTWQLATRKSDGTVQASRDAWQKAAQVEIEFLEGLR